MISMAGEAGRSPPTYHSMGSPRNGGCVSTFFHFFDWNPAKRFSATKRLTAGKPEKTMQRSRSARGDRGPEPKPQMLQICDHAQRATEEGIVSVVEHAAEIHPGGDASIRAPGVVARLMGLESLPEIGTRPQPHRRCQSYTGGGKLPSLAYTDMDRDVDSDGTLVLLRDLLKRDFKSGRRTLRDRMPGFANLAQEQCENITKRAVRGREEEAVSAFVDIPDVQRRINGSAKPPFLSQLAPSASSQRTIPLLPSKLHTPRGSPSTMRLEERKHVPELALQLQAAGWPLAGRRIRGLDHESSDEVSFRSDSDSLCMECANGSRRGSTWNASEGRDSTNEQQVEELNPGCSLPVQIFAHRKQRLERESSTLKIQPSSSSSSSSERRLRKSVSSNNASVREFKASGTRSPVVGPKLASLRTRSTVKAILSSKELGDALIESRRRRLTDRSQSPVPVENSGTSSASVESTSTASPTSDLTANSTVHPSAKAPKTRRPSPKFTRTTETNMKADAMAGKSVSKATPHGKLALLDGYRALKVRSLLKVGQRGSVSGSRVFQSAVSPSPAESGSFLRYGRALGAQKKGDELAVARKRKFGEQEMNNVRQPSPTLGEHLGKSSLRGIQRVREKVVATATPPAVQALVEYRLKLEDMASQNSCRIVSKHARARSIDEVFPELPFDFDHSNAFTSSVCATDMTMCDEQQVSASLSRSLERMFGQRFSHVDHFTGCGGGMPRGSIDWSSSPLIGNCEDANPPVDELTWVDEIGEQRADSPVCGRCCEGSCSGPSISSVSDDTSHVDDERNGDAWSSCASYNPADSDSPKTFELPDTDADSDLPEQKPDKPAFVEKISEEGDGTTTTTTAVEQQPSPVSILNSPFHDEACTTSESSVTDSHRQCNLDEEGFKSYNDNDKIRQALLDISMFQSLEVFTFDYKERITPSGGPKEEQSFVQEILSAAHFLSTPGSSPNWFNRDLAIDPSLFDRLELCGDMDHAEDDGPAGGVEKFQFSGGLWRCDRKLLFDCVNEAFALVPRRFRGSEMGLQQRPRGQKLVEAVYKKIEEWRKLPSHGYDLLIERDMCIDFGSWKDFGAEVAEVALDIESMLWKAIVEEAVVDILSTAKHR